jgi:Ca-activated chloride channel family protein
MFNSQMFENSRPDGVGVLEVVEEGGAQNQRRFVPLKRTHLAGEVAGPLATLRLTQTYAYTRAECDRTLEAVYRFPLPGDAAVTGVTVRFGDVEIRAELQAREAAEQSYDEAVRQGRQAALATRESPDVFTLRVAGLQPDQEVTVETDVVLLARAEGSDWTLRIPLTTAPRYVRADEADSPHAKGQPLLPMRDPGHRFSLDLRFDACEHVSSPAHQLETRPEPATEALATALQGLRVSLADGEVLPDRDCVLTWRPVQEPARPGLSVWLHHDRPSDHIYFLAQLAPPAAAPAPAVPRDVILLVDRSGSMGGAKWQAADWAVMKFLRDLTPQDAFALGLFHSTTRWFKPQRLEMAGPAAIDQAIRFVQQNTDSGGTELGVALEQALSHEALPGERARHLVIVTDAQVSDAGRILRLADAEARQSLRRRISVICIDAAPNAFLVNELTERGGGIARYLTSNPEEGDIATALDGVLAGFAQPVLANVRLEVDRQGAQAAGYGAMAGRQSGVTALDCGDLPRGRAIWTIGRAPRNGRDDIAFTVLTAGREAATTRADLAQPGATRPALKALFGARRVLTLETLLTAGYAREEAPEILQRLGYGTDILSQDNRGKQSAVYAENERDHTRQALTDLLRREALDYGLASSATAFVAQRTERGQVVEAGIAIPNALPAGWSEDFDAGNTHLFFMRAAGYSSAAAPAMAASMPFDFTGAAPIGQDTSGRMADAMTTYGARSDAAKEVDDTPHPSLARRLLSGLAGVLHRDASPAAPATPGRVESALFEGVPVFAGQEATLFDTARSEDANRLPANALLTRLTVRFPDGAPDADALGGDTALLLFIDDMAAPRARVSLADLIRQGGSRPLNLRRSGAQAVRLVLTDPSGMLARDQVRLEVRLT